MFDESNLTPGNMAVWREEYEASGALGCQVVTNAGYHNLSHVDIHADKYAGERKDYNELKDNVNMNNRQSRGKSIQEPAFASESLCVGNLVSGGMVHHTSNAHNVHFGIRNGSYVVGYVDADEASNTSNPFCSLVSGMGWLVRDGDSYITESLSLSGDNEDLSALTQAGRAQFASGYTSRTILGHDAEGRLLLLQLYGSLDDFSDGNTDYSAVDASDSVQARGTGVSLQEAADIAVDLGFVQAINLGGGPSSSMLLNHSITSRLSGSCPVSSSDADADTDSRNDNHFRDDLRSQDVNPPAHSTRDSDSLSRTKNVGGKQDLFRCEMPVSSLTCIHAMAPPVIELPQFKATPTQEPATSPSVACPPVTCPPTYPYPPPDYTSNPTYYPTTYSELDDALIEPVPVVDTHPTQTPTWTYLRPSYTFDDDWYHDDWNSNDNPAEPDFTSMSANSTAAYISALTHSLESYQTATFVLGTLLALSIIGHCMVCYRKTDDDDYNSSSHGRMNGLEMSRKQVSDVYLYTCMCVLVLYAFMRENIIYIGMYVYMYANVRIYIFISTHLFYHHVCLFFQVVSAAIPDISNAYPNDIGSPDSLDRSVNGKVRGAEQVIELGNVGEIKVSTSGKASKASKAFSNAIDEGTKAAFTLGGALSGAAKKRAEAIRPRNSKQTWQQKLQVDATS
jgi:hypothetical protein